MCIEDTEKDITKCLVPIYQFKGGAYEDSISNGYGKLDWQGGGSIFGLQGIQNIDPRK